MRFLMKVDYDVDIRLFRYLSTMGWYLALIAGIMAFPFLVDNYVISQFTFIFIFSIASVGLMLLTGYTGQISLGHAAFFAIGAYTSAILTTKLGLPFLLSLPISGIISGIIGIIVGLPALRLSGLYLAMATIGFGFIVEEILVRWESVTMGNIGITVEPARIGSLVFDTEMKQYYLMFVVLILAITGARNILRSSVGRAFIAIRDSEIAAQAMGISPAKFKTMAFILSAAFTGIAGALYAHKITFINPEGFTMLVSIELLAMVIIGGLGSLHGAVFGAVFVILLPQVIVMFKEILPAFFNKPGLEPTIYGLMIVLFILFEPMGLYGRWLKIKFYFEMFPLYRKDSFKRERKYQKAERRH